MDIKDGIVFCVLISMKFDLDTWSWLCSMVLLFRIFFSLWTPMYDEWTDGNYPDEFIFSDKSSISPRLWILMADGTYYSSSISYEA